MRCLLEEHHDGITIGGRRETNLRFSDDTTLLCTSKEELLELPHINYCLMTWGYHGQRIYKIQKRAIRTITLSKYNDHTATLKKIKLLTLKDIIVLQELKFYFKFVHKILPSYLLQWQLTTNTDIHTNNTRQQNARTHAHTRIFFFFFKLLTFWGLHINGLFDNQKPHCVYFLSVGWLPW